MASPITCSVEGCDSNSTRFLAGMCQACYEWSRRHPGEDPTQRSRIRRRGSVLGELQRAAAATTEECIDFPQAARPHVVFDGKNMTAARAVWVLAHGDPGNLVVLNSCQRGAQGCINIQHLFLGTAADRNRRPPLEFRTRRAKLTAEQVTAIRQRAGTQSQQSLAAEFGVSQPTISRVIIGDSYRYVTPPSPD